MSNITSELTSELRKLFDDVEFVIGILACACHVDDRRKILEFIRTGDDVSVETVTVMALDLNDLRNEVNPYD